MMMETVPLLCIFVNSSSRLIVWLIFTNIHKSLFTAPIKALCQEKYDDWREKFQRISIRCAMLTGMWDYLC